MSASTKLTIAAAALWEPEFQASFAVLQNGLYLIDSNDDLWHLVDTDGHYNTYARDERELGDKRGKMFTCH